MKFAPILLGLLILLGFAHGCTRHENPSRTPHAEITLSEVAALKTRSAAEAFVALHSLPHSSETLDTMRKRGVQVPTSARGSEGRFSFTVFLDSSEAVAHTDFYHYQDGHVTSIMIHVESVNKP